MIKREEYEEKHKREDNGKEKRENRQVCKGKGNR